MFPLLTVIMEHRNKSGTNLSSKKKKAKAREDEDGDSDEEGNGNNVSELGHVLGVSFTPGNCDQLGRTVILYHHLLFPASLPGLDLNCIYYKY